MKIEKISETQIRCTLNKQDLADRDLKISELAYGSEKAKELFHELITQASYECGFEAEDIPLMIEAIPVSGDCLVLIVTKVEDPDELDTRFSNFSSFRESSNEDNISSIASSVADEILECFGHLGALLNKDRKMLENTSSPEDIIEAPETPETPEALADYCRIFSFPTLRAVITLSEKIYPYYLGRNTLYKDESNGHYYLVLYVSDHTAEEFNRICNVLTEYATPIVNENGTLSYFAEHFKLVLENTAIRTLAEL